MPLTAEKGQISRAVWSMRDENEIVTSRDGVHSLNLIGTGPVNVTPSRVTPESEAPADQGGSFDDLLGDSLKGGNKHASPVAS